MQNAKGCPVCGGFYSGDRCHKCGSQFDPGYDPIVKLCRDHFAQARCEDVPSANYRPALADETCAWCEDDRERERATGDGPPYDAATATGMYDHDDAM